MRFDEETPTAILGAAVRALEAMRKPVNEKSLYEAVKSRGIDRGQVQDFLEKQKRGEEHPRKYFDGL